MSLMHCAFRNAFCWGFSYLFVNRFAPAYVRQDFVAQSLALKGTDFCHSLEPLLGCNSGVTHLKASTTVPAWASVLVFDTLIFALSCIRAFRISTPRCSFSRYVAYSFHMKFAGNISHSPNRIFDVLIRDGFLYYAVMFCTLSSFSNLFGKPKQGLCLNLVFLFLLFYFFYSKKRLVHYFFY